MGADILPLVIEKYKTREQLIQDGIWKGELYNLNNTNSQSIDRVTRGWIWKTLLLHAELDSNDTPSEHGGIESLLPIPENINSNAKDIRPLYTPIKKFSHGIRKLTPKEAVIHPLNKSAVIQNTNDHNLLNLEEALDIIDLDLSRLMIDDIFQKKEIHQLMKQLLYNYLVIKAPMNGVLTSNKKYDYKQGYHELLGVVFLELYSEHKDEMKNILHIYIKLMNRIEPIFYNEQAIIGWENDCLKNMVKESSPKLFNVLYSLDDHERKHNNIIWLIRWTRLLFLRELPMDGVLIIWDHILTFNIPTKILVASLIVTILLHLNKEIIALDPTDHDDIIELLLHLKSRKSMKELNCINLCKTAGNLAEHWICGNYVGMRHISNEFVKSTNIDPNRQRLEDRLRERVRNTLK